MSEIPAKATGSEDPSDGARTAAAADAAADVRRGATGGSALSSPGSFSGAGRHDIGFGSDEAPPYDAMWQSSPPGSIYDYIKVASFSIGPDGLVDQWSLRAEQLFGIPAEHAVGMDPIEAFID
ncbi:SpoIIE family protein phosphatase, partial [Streptomyces sp. NPDC001002]